jgi:hypothetical protein
MEIKLFCKRHPKSELTAELVISRSYSFEGELNIEPCKECLDVAKAEGAEEAREN